MRVMAKATCAGVSAVLDVTARICALLEQRTAAAGPQRGSADPEAVAAQYVQSLVLALACRAHAARLSLSWAHCASRACCYNPPHPHCGSQKPAISEHCAALVERVTVYPDLAQITICAILVLAKKTENEAYAAVCNAANPAAWQKLLTAVRLACFAGLRVLPARTRCLACRHSGALTSLLRGRRSGPARVSSAVTES